MEVDEMRRRFNEVVSSMISKKRKDNNAFLSDAEYTARIADVKRSKTILNTPGSHKSMKDYRMVKKYDVLTVSSRERLIKPLADNSERVLFYVTNEELFDIIHSTHTATGHRGRNRMVAELKNKYCNITTETVMAYLQQCCQRKITKPAKVPEPVVNSRAQVDLVDMQFQSYNGCRFIMVHQDLSTKFVLLRALKSKRAEEVAFNLLDIYTMFGAPAILHSENGREFVDCVLTELQKMWRDVKIVHGKGGAVECANIKGMLGGWMAENHCEDWTAGLKFVQFQTNRAFHSGIGTSPFEAMFGCPAKVGLASTGIPLDEIPNIKEEEDVEAALEAQQDDAPMLANENDGIFSETEIKTEFEDPPSCQKCYIFLASGTDDENNDRMCRDCKNQAQISEVRKRFGEYLEQQTPPKMMKSSDGNFEAGTTVSDVDGSPCNTSDMYKICTEDGILKQEFTTSQFNRCEELMMEETSAEKAF